MKKISLLVFAIFSAILLKAQTEDDAFRFSNINLLGTARYMGMGGAFGALGADPSVLSSNPAGLGLFKQSLFSITPMFSEGITKSGYLGSTNSDNKFNFGLGNLGIILTSRNVLQNKNDKSSLTFQFGFSLNRYANFNNREVIIGKNSSSSMMTDYVDHANGVYPSKLNPYDTWLAYQAYVIDPFSATDSSHYTSSLLNGNVDQSLRSEFSGSINEPVISVGANYNDKLYFGLSFGLPVLNYKENLSYTETNLDVNEPLVSYNINSIAEDNGSGFNVKFGVIYRILEWLRVGAAVHSPTFYKIDRTQSNEIQSSFADGGYYDVPSPIASWSYNLQTPAHYLGSAAVIIKKIAAIGIDYEYTDYSTMKLRNGSDGYNYLSENNNAQEYYTFQHSVRLGGELNLNPILVRLGFGFSTGPYTYNNLLEQKNISGGIGLRLQQFTFDIGYMYSFYKQEYYLYQYYLLPQVNQTITNQMLSLTFGYKF